MKKLAFFVEGYTEQYFIHKLLTEIAESKDIYIEVKNGFGGKKTPRKFITTINGNSRYNDQKYYVLIYNSCTDSRVSSDIRDNIERLSNNGFEKVIGLKDVYPIVDDEGINKSIRNRNYGIPQKFIPCEVILAVMEIEAWYIAEKSHFEKINSNLTIENIKKKLSIDLDQIDPTKIKHPAETLNSIYLLANKKYNKCRDVVQDTISVLDFEEIYCNLQAKIQSIALLVDNINCFLSEDVEITD